jgi:tartrate dehydrogenase/decarboxylase/D-malate dehydrogenase
MTLTAGAQRDGMPREIREQDTMAAAKPKTTKSNSMKIAVVPGDGIGNEVVPEGIRVLEAIGSRFGLDYKWDTYDWSCQRFAKTGAMMPADGLEQIAKHDAIYLGAVGWPGVPDHVSLWGLLIPIRRGFQQYINLRPVRLFQGLKSPLADRKPGDINYWIVRENNEGEYSSIGGRMYEGTDMEAAIQQAVFSKKGCDRVMRYAFELAKRHKLGTVTSATKSNGISISMPYWDERFAAVSKEYPGFKTNQFHIDILTAHLVRNPDWFDVIVGSNLFGDILSDLGPATTGTIAIAPGGNINPEREFPSMFEPVHGSAPDIAGKGIANPIGQIWSGAMMLEHLGHPEAAAAIVRAIEVLFAETDVRTRDMGGKATCRELGDAMVELVGRV